METIKQQFPSFILVLMSIVGSIGGFGWSLYNHSYVPAVGIIILTYLAWPQIKEHWYNIF